jgi:hypothetical protein
MPGDIDEALARASTGDYGRSPFENLLLAQQAGNIGEGLMPSYMAKAYQGGQGTGAAFGRISGMTPSYTDILHKKRQAAKVGAYDAMRQQVDAESQYKSGYSMNDLSGDTTDEGM